MSTSPTVALARDGTRLAYSLFPAPGNRGVVLVHSLAMDRDFWAPVVERLAGKASVLTFDCRGHGASDKPKGPYTVELFADDIADLMDHVGWPSALVAGASMGGCISLAFAAAYPRRTVALGLIDTTACYDDPKAWAERGDKAAKEGMAALTGFQTTRWFGDAFRASNPDAVKNSVEVFVRNEVPAYVETCRMLGACDKRDALAGMTMPTAVIVGEEDYATPVKMAEELHRGIAGSTLKVIPKARHLTPLEVPDTIAAELTALLERGKFV